MTPQILNYCDFDDQSPLCYIMLLLSRKKDNLDQTEQTKLKKIHRRIVTSDDEVVEALEHFKQVVWHDPSTKYRVYLSVNRRSLLKGLQSLQKEMIDIQFDLINGNTERLTTVARLDSRWKSLLARKNCRADKRFLLDIDIPNDVEENWQKVQSLTVYLRAYNINVHATCYTKNGFAVVCDAADPRMIRECINEADICDRDVDIKHDDYLYFGEFN